MPKLYLMFQKIYNQTDDLSSSNEHQLDELVEIFDILKRYQKCSYKRYKKNFRKKHFSEYQ